MATIAAAAAAGAVDWLVVAIALNRSFSSLANMRVSPRLRRLGRAQTDRQTDRQTGQRAWRAAEPWRGAVWAPEAAAELALLAAAAAAAARVELTPVTATSAASIRQVQLSASGTVRTAANSWSHACVVAVLLCWRCVAQVAVVAAVDNCSRVTSFRWRIGRRCQRFAVTCKLSRDVLWPHRLRTLEFYSVQESAFVNSTPNSSSASAADARLAVAMWLRDAIRSNLPDSERRRKRGDCVII